MEAPLYGAQSKSSIKNRRRLAELLMSQATDSSPVGHWTQALARGLQGVASGYISGKADREDSARRSALVEALSGAQSPSDLEALGLQYDEPMAFELAQGRRRDAELDYQHGRDATQDSRWQQNFDAEQAYRNQSLGLEREKFDWQRNAPPDPTADMREFEYAQNNPEFAKYQQDLKKAGATSISNTVDAGGRYLDKKLDEKEGESWAGYLDAADVSGGAMQDMQALEELLKVAPQGPLTGRAAEMFPGFSSAGDAVIATTKRIAPTLRTPGSGSTSDVEYQGMLQSVPRLSASPGGNQIILNMMKAKAQINMQRGEIVAAYQNGQIDAATARTELRALNRQSIMTPEMKALIGVPDQGDPGIDPLLDKYAPLQ